MLQTDIYRTKYLKEGEATKIDLNDIITNKLHGFVIEDFLNSSEIQNLLHGLKTIDKNKLVHIEKGFDSYPMTFAQFDQMVVHGSLSESDYFNASNNFISTFSEHFKVDILEKLNELFSKIKNSVTIDIPCSGRTQNQYVPFTFRELFPDDGCLKAHCENLFYQEFPSFFDKINAFSHPDNQLSFFIVLQQPKKGGELTLFDIQWDNKQKRLNDKLIKTQNENVFNFDDPTSIKRDIHSPKAGSLVVFKGGEIWHRVEKVLEGPSRITLGGFLSFSHDKKKLFSWS